MILAQSSATAGRAATDFMWLVTLLPFLSAVIIGFGGKRLGGRAHIAGIAAVGGGLVLSLVGFYQLAAGNATVEASWVWFELDSIELMLNAVNINLVAFSALLGQTGVAGQVFALFVIAVAAAEVGIGLAIVILIFRNRQSVDVEEMSLMKW